MRSKASTLFGVVGPLLYAFGTNLIFNSTSEVSSVLVDVHVEGSLLKKKKGKEVDPPEIDRPEKRKADGWVGIYGNDPLDDLEVFCMTGGTDKLDKDGLIEFTTKDASTRILTLKKKKSTTTLDLLI